MRFSDQFLDDLRDRVSIADVVGTRVTWDRKKTNVSRGDYWACCPFHGESRPSFHCEVRKGRYHCFGCGAAGNHFKFFMELDGVSFPRAVEMVAHLGGIQLPGGGEETPAEKRRREAAEQKRRAEADRKAADQRREEEEKAENARWLWKSGQALAATLAETYLNGRSIELVDLRAPVWPQSLRFHSGLLMPANQDIPVEFHRRRFPALIGAVQAPDRRVTAVWRIFLSAEGHALTNAEGKKIKLGFGPASGGAVRLGPVTETLRLAEGIETSLAVMALLQSEASVWATLSTSGMQNFQIPAGVRRLEIYADGDHHRLNKRTGDVMTPPGIRAAETLQSRARAAGVEVGIYPSPAPDDWLDVWQTAKKKRDDEQRYW